jgi:hypothetical protein
VAHAVGQHGDGLVVGCLAHGRVGGLHVGMAGDDLLGADPDEGELGVQDGEARGIEWVEDGVVDLSIAQEDLVAARVQSDGREAEDVSTTDIGILEGDGVIADLALGGEIRAADLDERLDGQAAELAALGIERLDARHAPADVELGVGAQDGIDGLRLVRRQRREDRKSVV